MTRVPWACNKNRRRAFRHALAAAAGDANVDSIASAVVAAVTDAETHAVAALIEEHDARRSPWTIWAWHKKTLPFPADGRPTKQLVRTGRVYCMQKNGLSQSNVLDQLGWWAPKQTVGILIGNHREQGANME